MEVERIWAVEEKRKEFALIEGDWRGETASEVRRAERCMYFAKNQKWFALCVGI